MLSVRAELARRILRWINDDQPVPPYDAIQLRNWAVRPEDILLPLEEIARRILDHEEKSK